MSLYYYSDFFNIFYDIFYDTFFIKILLSISFFDIFLKYLLNRKNLQRWYYLHAFANLLVCIYSFDIMILFLNDPITNINNPIWYNKSSIIISIIHIYHLLFFKCTYDDWFHHILFVFIGTIIHYKVNLGYLMSLYHFFICGLPGGIDYLLLGFVKDNLITKNSRLKIALELNIWIRAPMVISCWTFAYLWIIYSEKNL